MFALVPAAGHSTRMGRPKLALPLGASTVLECAVTALRAGGVKRVLVVTGPHVPELAPLARQAGATVLELPQPTPDMRTTIERGLDWAECAWQPGAGEAFLLCPADHPALDPGVLRALIQARGDRPLSIVIPTFNGQRGHPALIAWPHVAGIRALPPGAGLNRYLREHAAQTLEVPVDSGSVLLDLDTPADYERLRAGWQIQAPHR